MSDLDDHELRDSVSLRSTSLLNFHFLAQNWMKCNLDPYHKTKNPDGYVCMGVALNSLCTDILTERLNKGDMFNFTEHNQHYFKNHGEPHNLQIIAKFLTKYLNTHEPVDPEHLAVTSGAAGALSDLAHVLADPGDVFLLPSPMYPGICYDMYMRSLIETEPIPLTSQAQNGGKPFQLTASQLEKYILKARSEGKTVKGLVLINPSNPIGDIIPAKPLMEILNVCKKYQLHVISDELYALSRLEEKSTFTSVLAFPDLPDPSRTHLVYALSKDFGLTGLRVGIVHSRNPVVLRALQVLLGFSTVPSIVHDAAGVILNDTEWIDTVYLPTNVRRLREAYELTKSFLNRLKVPFIPVQAGIYVWIDLRRFLKSNTKEAERELFSEIMDTAKVYITLGTEFFCCEPGWFRVIFSVPPEDLKEGLRRLEKFLVEKTSYMEISTKFSTLGTNTPKRVSSVL